MKSLNRIQSRVCDTALYTSEVGAGAGLGLGRAVVASCCAAAFILGGWQHLSVRVPAWCLCLACASASSRARFSPCLPCPALPQNMLVCAPTGAGKTNVAMLTMLHEIGLHRWARWAGGGCAVLCCARWR